MTAADGERWAIVGGGILGMTLALRLAQRGLSVSLIERGEQLGGLASAWRLGEVIWDRHYHVTLLSDRSTRAILSELGLEHDMRWVPARTGFYTDGRLYSLSSAFDFLLFPPLGPISKARLAATVLHASRVTDWRPLEQITVEDWLRRWSGDRTFEKIWLPLLRAKLGEAYTKTSAAFIWATIQRMYAARRTGLKQELFGYLPGGYARALDAFRQRLEQVGVHLFLGMTVAAVRKEQAGEICVELASGTRIRFDKVVLTVPAPIAAQLCPGISDREQKLLEQVEYQGIVCASLLLRKPLADYYITNVTDPRFPFTAVIEMSALVDREQFGGNALVYLPRYLASDDSGFNLPDHEWGERAVEALSAMYRGFDPQDVLVFQVSRERHVYALPTLRFSERVPPLRTSVPGVYLVNSAQIVNGTLNVNETVRLAEESVDPLLSAADEQSAASGPWQAAQ